MAEMGRWNGHVFEVSPGLIRGWAELKITAGCETTELNYQGKKYAEMKMGKGTSVSLVVGLNALTGCDVREEAMRFADEAQRGEKAYFYVGDQKLVPCELMLTDATISNIEITNNGIWVRADAELTMKQASKDDRDEAPRPAPVNNWIEPEEEEKPKGFAGGSALVNLDALW